ncbi:glycerophosphoryl diester phosphodiesterase [Gottschalkia purinilytica]|uniref:Glycerophosphoryl diester phosphodiesterase n=1 Tax=Gottschalkia purinilytica TaxID=1503 RepID=A0A0L0WAC6_GOTPU|nr:glycerophosphodiester phosphodiesterase family protein [Gottschalkia purinilytica]KNF08275.1 glycerophosphoryl diester phosphodiesterase [Gottschalkia purinilytica]
MKIRKRLVAGIICFIFIFSTFTSHTVSAQNGISSLPRLVAHAGGAIYGFQYTNSMEALNESYKNGFRFIELDFDLTTDGYPVLIHDWSHMSGRLFMEKPKLYSLQEFMTKPKFLNLTLMNVDMLAGWLANHSDVFIVTDIKNSNLSVLKLIKERYPSLQKQFIPQIYSFGEYNEVRKMGYENIILTLYLSHATDDQIVEFARANRLLGITMPSNRGFTTLPKRLSEIGVPTYVHTINELATYENLRKHSVYGIYTDYFQPNRWVE